MVRLDGTGAGRRGVGCFQIPIAGDRVNRWCERYWLFRSLRSVDSDAACERRSTFNLAYSSET